MKSTVKLNTGQSRSNPVTVPDRKVREKQGLCLTGTARPGSGWHIAGLSGITQGRRQTGDLAQPLFPGPETQKTLTVRSGLSRFDAWQFPTLAWGDPTLPSALRRFTSEFGMGSGGTTALQPPGKFFSCRPVSFAFWPRCHKTKSHGPQSAERHFILYPVQAENCLRLS